VCWGLALLGPVVSRHSPFSFAKDHTTSQSMQPTGISGGPSWGSCVLVKCNNTWAVSSPPASMR
jgi:hypothetical protein